MKVIVKRKFRDINTGNIRKVGEIFTCNKERYNEILSKGNYVEEIKTNNKK